MTQDFHGYGIRGAFTSFYDTTTNILNIAGVGDFTNVGGANNAAGFQYINFNTGDQSAIVVETGDDSISAEITVAANNRGYCSSALFDDSHAEIFYKDTSTFLTGLLCTQSSSVFYYLNPSLGRSSQILLDTNLTYRGGNVFIGADTQRSAVHISGTLRYRDGSQQQGRILTSDSSGNATWLLHDIAGSVSIGGLPSQTIYTVSHSLGAVPSHIFMTPTSADAATPFFIDNKTATTFDIVFINPPPLGTGNIRFDWLAKP